MPEHLLIVRNYSYKEIAYLLVKFPLFPAMPAVEMPLAALLVKFQFEDTSPQKINTNR